MPEIDPRTPDPFKRDPAGRELAGTATDRDTAFPEAAPATGQPAEADAPVHRTDSRAAGSRGAHSKSGRSKPAKEGRAHGPVYLWIKEVLTVVAIAVVLSFLIKTFLFRAFYIPS